MAEKAARRHANQHCRTITAEEMETAANYDAWYQTPRGHWIGDREFRLLWNMIQPKTGEALLDVGCGSGYFSQRFSDHGIGVIGVDIDDEMVAYARKKHSNLRCLAGSALALPFHDKAFDHVAAVASLCFIDCPQCALAEMWRVSRKTVTLGLLNRHSLLFREKSGRGGYAGARWDTVGEIRRKWLLGLFPEPAGINIRFAIFFHQGGSLARWMERLLPSRLPWGSFLAVTLRK